MKNKMKNKLILLLLLISSFGYSQISGTGGAGVNYSAVNKDLVFFSTTNVIPTVAPANGIDMHVLLNGDRYDWDGTQWLLQPSNNDKVEYTGNNIVPTGMPAKGIDTRVLSNGDRYDWNGTAWIKQPKVPELVTYSVSPLAFPANPTSGDEHFVTSNGTRTGVVIDQYIWDGTAWEKRPQYKDIQRLLENNGTIKHSLANEVRWTNRLILMTGGSDALSPSGYYDLYFPTGTIPVQGGVARAIVAPLSGQSGQTGGILLNVWESLWYKVTAGSNNTTVNANYLITSYASANTQILTDEWVVIASRDDTQKIKWFNGDVTEPGTQFGGSLSTTMSNWTAMKQRVQADGYFFSPAGNTTVPTSFGFTAGIRWINGGTSPYINNQGYVDVTPASKTAGTVIYGVGRANTTWRLMTAAEKPEWFGGATLGVNPILAASTTVVDLNDNETLYYAPSIDNTGANTGTWYIENYSVTTTPTHWLPIVSRQISFSHSTMQILLGGVQTTLKAGDAKWMGQDVSAIQMLHHAQNVSISGERYTRLTTNPFFAGAGANGVFNSQTAGAMVSWDDSGIIYGISEGYASWGNQYTFVNVPPVGTQIPMANNGAGTITRTVQTIGLHRYIPLAAWEALWFIPSAYTGGTNSTAANFIITNYLTNHYVPAGAVCIAKLEHNYGIITSGNQKIRVRWADGQYTQTGLSYAVTGQVFEYDHAQGNGDWRSITVAGSIPLGGTAPLPAVAGVVGPYGAPYNPEFMYITDPVEPKGTIKLSGLINMNGYIPTANANVAFIPGVYVRKEPIISTIAVGSVNGDNKPISVELRFVNGAVGGQNGILVRVQGTNMSATAPNWAGAGTPIWLSLDNIILNHL
jgi:hypothetical protein